MFVMPQTPATVLPAWAVFDPEGHGVLTIKEVQAAFALFGDLLTPLDVQAEFELLDADGSGTVELKEFGVLIQRLSSIAQGAEVHHKHVDEGISGAVRTEIRLLRLLNSQLLMAIPLASHTLARRVLSNMRLLGFAPEDVEVVLRALFLGYKAPGGALRATEVMQAWLVLAGVEWSKAHLLTAAELAEMDSYVEASPPTLEHHTLPRRRSVRASSSAPHSAEAAVQPQGGSEPPRVRVTRASRATTMASHHRFVTHKSEFLLDTPIPLGEFERIVSIFGDYRTDNELYRAQNKLAGWFETRAEEDAAHSAEHHRDSHSNHHAHADTSISFSDFVDVLELVRPLEAGEQHEDRELLALADKHDLNAPRELDTHNRPSGSRLHDGDSSAIDAEGTAQCLSVRMPSARLHGDARPSPPC